MSGGFEEAESQRWIDPFGRFVVESKLLRSEQVERAARLLPALDTRLGSLAVAKGYMSARDVYVVLAAAQDREALFGEVAVELNMLRENQITELLVLQRSPFLLFLLALLLSENASPAELAVLVERFAERQGLTLPTPLPSAVPSSTSQRDLLRREEQLFRTLDKLTGIAPRPAILSRILELIDDPGETTEGMTSLIASDPALATQLLRVARSATDGPRVAVTYVAEAVRLLGARGVRQLVLPPTILEKLSGPALPIAERVWEHSMRSAVWAQELGALRGLSDDVYTHGLLHELGHLALLQAFPAECRRSEQLAGGDATLEQAERQVFGTTHADVGFYLCRLWTLADSIVQATLYHQAPTVILHETPGILESTRVVHAACRLSDAPGCGVAREPLDAAFLDYHSLTHERIDTLRARVEQRMRSLSFAG